MEWHSPPISDGDGVGECALLPPLKILDGCSSHHLRLPPVLCWAAMVWFGDPGGGAGSSVFEFVEGFFVKVAPPGGRSELWEPLLVPAQRFSFRLPVRHGGRSAVRATGCISPLRWPIGFSRTLRATCLSSGTPRSASRAFVAGGTFSSRLPVRHGGRNAVRATGWLFGSALWVWRGGTTTPSSLTPSRSISCCVAGDSFSLPPASAARGAECCLRSRPVYRCSLSTLQIS